MTVDPAEIRRLIRIATARTGNAVYDEDLVQETSLRALEAFRRVPHVSYPRAFLMKIVCDAVRDHWRRRRTSEDIAAIDERFLSVRPNFEDDLDRRRCAARLRAALLSLSADKRRLLRRFYEDGLSINQIALLENASASAVKMQLLRVRRELARIIGIPAIKKSR